MLLASKISLRTLPLRLPILSARLPTLPVRLPTLPVRLPTLPTRLPTPSVYRCYRPVFPPQYPQHQYQPYYQNQRFWIVVGTAGGLAGAYYVTHLETVPISGRRRFLDVTPQQEEAMSKQAYKEIIAQYGNRILPQNHPYTIYVRRIAKRIIQVSGMQNLNWEFYVIDSPEKNAFVLPGGKVFVFTGILPIAGNEDGMAAVLGHEIAHQLARHSAEKLSFIKIIFAFQLFLSLFIDPYFIFNRIFFDFGILMPFSRKCEIEADVIGLRLMAQACFDPREAIYMWQRMDYISQKTGEGKVPAFVSTHPAHKTRIKNLKKEMDSALQQRAASDCYTEMGLYADMFDRAWANW